MNATDFDRQHLWRFRAKTLRIIDGDTFTALCDCGFHGRHEAHIRIAGLDTPERGDPGFLAAQLRLQNALPDRPEWPLRIVSRQRETVVSEVRSFERYIADVFVVMPDGTMLDVVQMVRP